jgi:MOSC domain-containing protein YiiM
MQGKVLSVSLSPVHGFHKEIQTSIQLLAGLGVEGDAHAGVKAQHLYRQRLDPEAPNLAQVHFLHRELFDEVTERGFALAPGLMGENVLTEGLDLITLPTGTIFRIGARSRGRNLRLPQPVPSDR